jgi:hypothetical protein
VVRADEAVEERRYSCGSAGAAAAHLLVGRGTHLRVCVRVCVYGRRGRSRVAFYLATSECNVTREGRRPGKWFSSKAQPPSAGSWDGQVGVGMMHVGSCGWKNCMASQFLGALSVVPTVTRAQGTDR